MLFSFALLVLGFILLVECADYFVEGCSSVAKALGIPSLIIGLTIVAFGTSAPEAAVSITASIQNMNDISLGNVLGSNICNLLLVLGLSGMFGVLTVKKEVMIRDFKYLMFSNIILLIITFKFINSNIGSGLITRIHGLILLGFLVIYLYVLIKDTFKFKSKVIEKQEFRLKDIILIIIGFIGIIIGGNLVVNNATNIAKYLNISENIIALTVVAIGTSLPEIVTSIVAADKGEVDIAIGNVIGSNIFNVFFVLGLSSSISPITFNMYAYIDVVVMTIASVIVYLILLRNKKLGVRSGILLFVMYIVYMFYVLVR